jgi:branched-chain amino acid transport system substrate-binding protein
VVERFRAAGFEPESYPLLAYGAVQVWAQAVEAAGSLQLEAVVAVLREHQFDTVGDSIDFDDKGDPRRAGSGMICLAGGRSAR